MPFPDEQWPQIVSNNPLERADGELSAEAVGAFSTARLSASW